MKFTVLSLGLRKVVAHGHICYGGNILRPFVHVFEPRLHPLSTTEYPWPPCTISSFWLIGALSEPKPGQWSLGHMQAPAVHGPISARS